MIKVARMIAVLVGGLSLGGCSYSWLQWAGNERHSGGTGLETRISAANVAGLHTQFVATLPARADGAPTYVGGVAIAGTTRNVVLVTTVSGDLIALDAASGVQLWLVRFGPGAC